jgi:hypothetical protein
MDHAKTKSVQGAPLSANPVFAGKLGQLEMQIEVMTESSIVTHERSS